MTLLAFRNPLGLDGDPAPVPDRRNLCPNPALGANTIGWTSTVGFQRVSGLTGVLERDNAYQAVQSMPSGTSFGSPRGAVVPGRTYTVSIYVGSDYATTYDRRLTWYDSGGTVVSSTAFQQTFVPDGQFTRASTTAVAPAGAATVAINFTQFGLEQTVGIITMCLIEETGTVNSYGDGESPDWQWDGTRYNSVSAYVSVGSTPVVNADAAAVSDLADLAAAVAGLDAATEAELAVAVANLAGADAATVVDDPGALAATLATSDSVTGADAPAVLDVAAAGADSASVTETAAGSATPDAADAATLDDVAIVDTTESTAAVDSASLTEVAGPVVDTAGADAATSVPESGVLDAAPAGSDSAASGEAADPATVTVDAADPAAVTESAELDTGASAVTDSDVVTTTDVPGVVATFVDADDLTTAGDAGELVAGSAGTDVTALTAESAEVAESNTLSGSDAAVVADLGVALPEVAASDTAAAAESAVSAVSAAPVVDLATVNDPAGVLDAAGSDVDSAALTPETPADLAAGHAGPEVGALTPESAGLDVSGFDTGTAGDVADPPLAGVDAAESATTGESANLDTGAFGVNGSDIVTGTDNAGPVVAVTDAADAVVTGDTGGVGAGFTAVDLAALTVESAGVVESNTLAVLDAATVAELVALAVAVTAPSDAVTVGESAALVVIADGVDDGAVADPPGARSAEFDVTDAATVAEVAEFAAWLDTDDAAELVTAALLFLPDDAVKLPIRASGVATRDDTIRPAGPAGRVSTIRSTIPRRVPPW